MRNLILRRPLPHKLTLLVLCTQLLLAYPCALAQVGPVDPRVREALSILVEATEDIAEEVARLRQDVNSLGEWANQFHEYYLEVIVTLELILLHYALALDYGSATDQTLLLLMEPLLTLLDDDDE